MIHGIRDFPAMTSSVSSILTSIRMGKRRQKWETFKTFGEANTRKIEIEYSQQVGNFVIPNLRTTVSGTDEGIRFNFTENKMVAVRILQQYRADQSLHRAISRGN